MLTASTLDSKGQDYHLLLFAAFHAFGAMHALNKFTNAASCLTEWLLKKSKIAAQPHRLP